ncbi:hypothetical protein RND71_022622 [Anisodus tanguticus]|uniref:Uncharacterized protein n=1 Tax=Anisodus tanguticus TaxID=243964 RepID=A0AAE1RTC5_9SOLA|nr:hypothetical protein RND71_022622 [Anisodus tanguticus]
MFVSLSSLNTFCKDYSCKTFTFMSFGSLKRSRKFQLEDRLFSLSSVTSPAAEELGLGREDGRPDPTQGRMRGGGFANNGQGKPKKGRTGPRDGKKFRISNDLDLDDDDPDSSLR